MGRNITVSEAKIDDVSQMRLFLRSIPNPDGLESLLLERKVVSTRSYDDDAMTARFVRSDGATVVCYTVEQVTIDEGEMIAAQCELLDHWSPENFSSSVHIALDPEI
ncbi:MAG TPA: hypothetical protein VHW95_01235 [Steroidobacteraceae bacterium]|jgi:hypothetical protein|nr:hypothetical protein [Steroidobacteraceae bacterium]